MNILGASDLVAPLLCLGVHAGVEVGVVEDDGVCVEHGPHGRAAAVGQDAAEHLPVPVEPLHTLLMGQDMKATVRVGQRLKTQVKAANLF